MADFCTKCVINWCLNDLSTVEERLAELDPKNENYKWQIEIVNYNKDFLANKTVDDLYCNINPDIDVFKIAEGLSPGYVSSGHICEGCGLTAIRKTESGDLKFAYLNFSAKAGDPVEWHDFPDYRKLNCSLVNLVKAYKEKMDQQRLDADYEKLYSRKLNDIHGGMVFEKYKTIYFPIQKVACSSIKVFLTDFADFYLVDINDLDKFKDYFKFTFVRNPWDRLVSCYVNKIAEAVPPYSFPLNWLRIPFKDFVQGVSCVPDDDCSNYHIKSQYLSIVNNGKLVVDFVGRFENFKEDMEKVVKTIGLSSMDLPHLVKSERKHYARYYNHETETIVAERYSKDIKMFHYYFERMGNESLLL